MADNTLSAKIQLRRDTATNWTTTNPILLLGEQGLELDTGFIKIGDGTTAWNTLSYQKVENSHKLDGKHLSEIVLKAGDTMSGDLDMGGNDLVNAGFETFTTLPTTFQGTQITFGGKVWTWNVAEGKYKCDSDYLKIGGRNLVLNSDTRLETNDYHIGVINLSEDIQDGEILTVTAWGELAEGQQVYVGYYGSTSTAIYASKVSNGRYSATFEFHLNPDYPYDVRDKLTLYNLGNVNYIGHISKIKLEKGNIPTDWTPAPEDKADNDQSINYDLSAEPTETGTKTKTANTLWQNLFNHTNFLWAKVKDLFSAIPLSVNDGYIPRIDDVNKKLVKSNINDDGTTPKYGANTIWHSGNDGSGSGLDADTLDGHHLNQDLNSWDSPTFNKINITTPTQNYNPFGGGKIYNSIDTNIVAGKWKRLTVTIDGVVSTTAPKDLTDLNGDKYSSAGLVGIQGGSAKVININFDNINGYYNPNGITYGNGFVTLISYYIGRYASFSCRVRKLYGGIDWINIPLIQIGSTLRGEIPDISFVTDIEFTLTPDAGTSGPYISGINDVFAITQFEYHASRMSIGQSAVVSSVGGYIGGMLHVDNLEIDNSGQINNLNANKLQGKLAADFATSAHNHDTAYLGLTAKAADSAKLDGYDSVWFNKVEYHNGLEEDWNTLTAGSPYQAKTFRIEASVQNPPLQGVYNWTLYQQGDVSRGSQLAIGAYGMGNNMFFRGSNYASNNWKPWAKVWHSDNFDPGSKADTTSLNGTQNYLTKYGATGITQSSINDNGSRVDISKPLTVSKGSILSTWDGALGGGCYDLFAGSYDGLNVNTTSNREFRIQQQFLDGGLSSIIMHNGHTTGADTANLQYVQGIYGRLSAIRMYDDIDFLINTGAGSSGSQTVVTPSIGLKITQDGYAQALSGFKKGSLDNTRMLLAGGGDKLLSDFPLLDNGKIQSVNLPDYVLGQVLFGGTIDGGLDCTISLNCQTKYGLSPLENISTLSAVDYEGVYFIATHALTISYVNFETGDWVISNGLNWEKIDNTDAVSSVNGQNGAVTITLSGLGGQPLDADLTAIAALTGTSGLLKKTAADTWSLDTNNYLADAVINDLGNNYIPKWDDSNNKFINGQIRDNGLGIGINTDPEAGYRMKVIGSAYGSIHATDTIYCDEDIHCMILVATNTSGSPLQVTSTTKVANLNVDMLDDRHAGNLANQIPISNLTLNSHLNADYLDGYHASNAYGNIPISNNTLNVGLNADLLDGYHSGSFAQQKYIILNKLGVPTPTLGVVEVEINSDNDTELLIDETTDDDTEYRFRLAEEGDREENSLYRSNREFVWYVIKSDNPLGLRFTFVSNGSMTNFYKSENFIEIADINVAINVVKVIKYTAKYIESAGGFTLNNEIFTLV